MPATHHWGRLLPARPQRLVAGDSRGPSLRAIGWPRPAPPASRLPTPPPGALSSRPSRRRLSLREPRPDTTRLVRGTGAAPGRTQGSRGPDSGTLGQVAQPASPGFPPGKRQELPGGRAQRERSDPRPDSGGVDGGGGGRRRPERCLSPDPAPGSVPLGSAPPRSLLRPQGASKGTSPRPRGWGSGEAAARGPRLSDGASARWRVPCDHPERMGGPSAIGPGEFVEGPRAAGTPGPEPRAGANTRGRLGRADIPTKGRGWRGSLRDAGAASCGLLIEGSSAKCFRAGQAAQCGQSIINLKLL